MKNPDVGPACDSTCCRQRRHAVDDHVFVGHNRKTQGVMYTRRMMLASALNLLQPSEASPDSRVLNVMPHSTLAGCICADGGEVRHPATDDAQL